MKEILNKRKIRIKMITTALGSCWSAFYSLHIERARPNPRAKLSQGRRKGTERRTDREGDFAQMWIVDRARKRGESEVERK